MKKQDSFIIIQFVNLGFFNDFYDLVDVFDYVKIKIYGKFS